MYKFVINSRCIDNNADYAAADFANFAVADFAVANFADFECHNKFTDTFPTGLSTPLCMFSHLSEGKWHLIKDKRKHLGTVDKCSLKQKFHKSDVIIFAMWKLWSNQLAQRQAGWQSKYG